LIQAEDEIIFHPNHMQVEEDTVTSKMAEQKPSKMLQDS